jgi:hypothetical protein
MILKTISSSLDVLNKSADFVKKLQEIEMNFKLPDEFKKINAKLDQDITRKIKSGYQSIRFAVRKGADKDSVDEHIEDARNNLGDCVNLSDELDTAGIPNGDIMATAHYGLAIVFNLKSKQDMTAYHLLKAFQTSPRKTRERVPAIYDQLFKSECGDFVGTMDRNTATDVASYSLGRMNNNLFTTFGTQKPQQQPSQPSSEDEAIRIATDIGKGILKGATFLGAAALYVASAGRIPVPPNLFAQGANQVNKEVDKISPDSIISARENQRRLQVIENLVRDNEARAKIQDDCCRKTATRYLQELGLQ